MQGTPWGLLRPPKPSMPAPAAQHIDGSSAAAAAAAAVAAAAEYCVTHAFKIQPNKPEKETRQQFIKIKEVPIKPAPLTLLTVGSHTLKGGLP